MDDPRSKPVPDDRADEGAKVAADRSTAGTKSASLLDSFRSQAATWIVASAIGILTLFSSKLSENIKFALNKADLRTKYFEELVSDVSEFDFEAENWTEQIGHNWTTEAALKQTVSEYNTSITSLRKKEWVYRSWLERYWQDEQAAAFSQYMSAVKAFDAEVHGLNGEIESVINKKKERFDPKTSAAAAQRLEPMLKKVRETSTDLIKQLQ